MHVRNGSRKPLKNNPHIFNGDRNVEQIGPCHEKETALYPSFLYTEKKQVKPNCSDKRNNT